ncbi:MAG TPA: hypothetical protein VHM25_21810 [Polyangiaceae bacterium]|jgi:hypothetical protein|nr:hypothetical protein [Polyangiaceae bacterium]
MKYGALVICVTFALLGVSAPAFADAPAGSNLQAGGLKPPDAVESDPNATNPTPATQTEAQLDRADKEDSGRGLEFAWLNAELGPSYVGLQALKADNLVDGTDVKSKGLGMTYGAGLGVRLLAFTLGARFRFGNFSDWQLWTLGAEAGMHIPLGRLEPYFTVGAGYASLGGFKSDVVANAHGLDVRGSAGLDFYLSNTFSVGANLSGDLLFLSRSATASTSALPAVTIYNQDGSGIGAGGTLSLVLGLHF